MVQRTRRYLIRRVVVVLLTLFVVTLLSFLLMRLSPIDPATAYVKRNSAIVTQEQIDEARVMLGLDKPLPVQYFDWVVDALHMDFGISLGTGNPVTEELAKTVPVTLTVVAYSAVIMSLGVLGVGMLGYLWRQKTGGMILSFLTMFGISVPGFYLGTAFIDLFAVRLGWISVSGNSGFARYFPVALCLVIGANLGSGLLAMLNNSAANAAARRVALGSLLFKLVGSLIILPFVHVLAESMDKLPLPKAELVIYFHVFYNLVRCLAMLPFVDPMARFCKTIIRDEPELDAHLKPKHLDVSALDTPTLALANAARETLRIGDAMEQMMEGLNKVMHGEPREEKELRKLADDINVLYTAIKLYLARMPKEELAEEESRRWAEIIEMALNLEQASDIVERMGSEIADKSLAARRAFSLDGLKELDALYEQLLSNLKLAMSVFFSGDVTSARRLRRSKHRFRILNRRYSHAHVDRLHQQNVQSIETSSLHLGLLGDMQRLNSLFCSVAYSVLEQPDEDEGRDEY